MEESLQVFEGLIERAATFWEEDSEYCCVLLTHADSVNFELYPMEHFYNDFNRRFCAGCAFTMTREDHDYCDIKEVEFIKARFRKIWATRFSDLSLMFQVCWFVCWLHKNAFDCAESEWSES